MFTCIASGNLGMKDEILNFFAMSQEIIFLYVSNMYHVVPCARRKARYWLQISQSVLSRFFCLTESSEWSRKERKVSPPRMIKICHPTQRTDLWYYPRGGGGVGMDWEFGISRCNYYIQRMDKHQGLTAQPRALYSVS